MSKKEWITEAEKQLFRAHMQDAQAMNSEARMNLAFAKPTHCISTPPNFTDHSAPDPVDYYPQDSTNILGSTELLYAKDGVQKRFIKQLRYTFIPEDATIILHGMTLPTAHKAVHQLIAHACLHSWRYVRIVHGKGSRSAFQKPILKNALNQWLRAHRQVLAFCSSPPQAGGTGAVHVRLKL